MGVQGGVLPTGEVRSPSRAGAGAAPPGGCSAEVVGGAGEPGGQGRCGSTSRVCVPCGELFLAGAAAGPPGGRTHARSES